MHCGGAYKKDCHHHHHHGTRRGDITKNWTAETVFGEIGEGAAAAARRPTWTSCRSRQRERGSAQSHQVCRKFEGVHHPPFAQRASIFTTSAATCEEEAIYTGPQTIRGRKKPTQVVQPRRLIAFSDFFNSMPVTHHLERCGRCVSFPPYLILCINGWIERGHAKLDK